jgi:hypothetical protein
MTAQARVAWREKGLRFEKAAARLLDFSERGARVLASVNARVGQMVWVGLATLPGEWVKAEVQSSDLMGNQWLCRLEFREPCPAGIVEVVRFGPCAGSREPLLVQTWEMADF